MLKRNPLPDFSSCTCVVVTTCASEFTTEIESSFNKMYPLLWMLISTALGCPAVQKPRVDGLLWYLPSDPLLVPEIDCPIVELMKK